MEDDVFDVTATTQSGVTENVTSNNETVVKYWII